MGEYHFPHRIKYNSPYPDMHDPNDRRHDPPPMLDTSSFLDSCLRRSYRNHYLLHANGSKNTPIPDKRLLSPLADHQGRNDSPRVAHLENTDYQRHPSVLSRPSHRYSPPITPISPVLQFKTLEDPEKNLDSLQRKWGEWATVYIYQKPGIYSFVPKQSSSPCSSRLHRLTLTHPCEKKDLKFSMKRLVPHEPETHLSSEEANDLLTDQVDLVDDYTSMTLRDAMIPTGRDHETMDHSHVHTQFSEAPLEPPVAYGTKATDTRNLSKYCAVKSWMPLAATKKKLEEQMEFFSSHIDLDEFDASAWIDFYAESPDSCFSVQGNSDSSSQIFAPAFEKKAPLSKTNCGSKVSEFNVGQDTSDANDEKSEKKIRESVENIHVVIEPMNDVVEPLEEKIVEGPLDMEEAVSAAIEQLDRMEVSFLETIENVPEEDEKDTLKISAHSLENKRMSITNMNKNFLNDEIFLITEEEIDASISKEVEVKESKETRKVEPRNRHLEKNIDKNEKHQVAPEDLFEVEDDGNRMIDMSYENPIDSKDIHALSDSASRLEDGTDDLEMSHDENRSFSGLVRWILHLDEFLDSISLLEKQTQIPSNEDSTSRNEIDLELVDQTKTEDVLSQSGHVQSNTPGAKPFLFPSAFCFQSLFPHLPSCAPLPSPKELQNDDHLGSFDFSVSPLRSSIFTPNHAASLEELVDDGKTSFTDPTSPTSCIDSDIHSEMTTPLYPTRKLIMESVSNEPAVSIPFPSIPCDNSCASVSLQYDLELFLKSTKQIPNPDSSHCASVNSNSPTIIEFPSFVEDLLDFSIPSFEPSLPSSPIYIPPFFNPFESIDLSFDEKPTFTQNPFLQ